MTQPTISLSIFEEFKCMAIKQFTVGRRRRIGTLPFCRLQESMQGIFFKKNIVKSGILHGKILQILPATWKIIQN